MVRTRSTRVRGLVACGLLATLGLTACGSEDFANERRPPVQLPITGVITEDEVTIQPNRFGAGPIVLTISNQTGVAHTVSIEGASEGGDRVIEETAPINPQDTATIQQSLAPGTYRVTASSDGADDIQPGRIVVGEPRSSSSDELEVP